MFLVLKKNRLIETVLLSTHSICFGSEIEFFFDTHSLLKQCFYLSFIVQFYVFLLVGGTSIGRDSPYKREYLYI